MSALTRLPGPIVALVSLSALFGAVAKVEGIAEALPAGARVLVVDAEGLLSIDASGLTALENVRLAAERSGVRFVVCGLAGETLSAARRLGLVDLIGVDNLFDDRERAFAGLAVGAMAK